MCFSLGLAENIKGNSRDTVILKVKIVREKCLKVSGVSDVKASSHAFRKI